MGIGKFITGEVGRAINSKETKILVNKHFAPWRKSSKDWQEEKRGLTGFLYEFYFGREEK